MAEPHNSSWPDTVSNIATVGHRQWMDSSCIDAYLMNYWFDNLQNAQVIYLPTKYLASLHGNGLEPDEIQSLSDFIGPFDDISQLRDRPYALVIHHVDHFFVAAFDYKRRCINVYGRYITMEGPVFGWMDYRPENDEDTWIKGDIWRGLTIYKNLEIALFNESLEDEIVCNSVNWIQVTMIILFLVQ